VFRVTSKDVLHGFVIDALGVAGVATDANPWLYSVGASREARLRGPRRGTAGGSQVLASYAEEPHLADKTATD
jgi:hypothetical protein